MMISQKLSACVAGAFFAVAILVAPLGSAHAADPQSRVMLQLFQVKVVDASGAPRGQLPITVYVDSSSRKASESICTVAPRVRDAIFSHLRKRSFRQDADGKLDVAAIAADLDPVIRAAIRRDTVAGVEVREGGPKVAAAAAAVFQRVGCIGVSDAG